MEKDDFLSKFKDQIEKIGKDGIIGIMKSAHLEINKKDIKNIKKRGVYSLKVNTAFEDWNEIYNENITKKRKKKQKGKNFNLRYDNSKLNAFNEKPLKLKKVEKKTITNKISNDILNRAKSSINNKNINIKETNLYKDKINRNFSPIIQSKKTNIILNKANSKSSERKSNVSKIKMQSNKLKKTKREQRAKTTEDIIVKKILKLPSINLNNGNNKYQNKTSFISKSNTKSVINDIKREVAYLNKIQKQNNDLMSKYNNPQNYYNDYSDNNNYYPFPKEIPFILPQTQKKPGVTKVNNNNRQSTIEVNSNSFTNNNYQNLEIIEEEREDEENTQSRLMPISTEPTNQFEILMNQRFMFQQMLPSTSKFKLKSF